MIERATTPLLRPRDIVPSSDEVRIVGTFNPGAARYDGATHLLVRTAEVSTERQNGSVPLLKADLHGGFAVDWVSKREVDLTDPRVPVLIVDSRAHLSSVSHLRHVLMKDGVTVDHIDETPTFVPTAPYEAYGIEDPRITLIEDSYYITYVAVSKHGIATALASTSDFRTFFRHGILFPPENKDVVLFPERIQGKIVALHRPSGAMNFGPPEIWMATSPDFRSWGDHRVVLSGDVIPDSVRMGAGTPPIRVEEGWLSLFHWACRRDRSEHAPSYVAGALLLDGEDPSRVLRVSVKPLFLAAEAFECKGYFDEVVFPTGIVREGEAIYVYYGAADTVCAVAIMGLDAIREHLREDGFTPAH